MFAVAISKHGQKKYRNPAQIARSVSFHTISCPTSDVTESESILEDEEEKRTKKKISS